MLYGAVHTQGQRAAAHLLPRLALFDLRICEGTINIITATKIQKEQRKRKEIVRIKATEIRRDAGQATRS